MGCAGSRSKTIKKSDTRVTQLQSSLPLDYESQLKLKTSYKVVIHEVESPSTYSIYG